MSLFIHWGNKDALPWYEAYNAAKHDRQESFEDANFEHLIDAVGGLVILLSSQFLDQDFSPETPGLALEGNEYYQDGMESATGGYLRIKSPDSDEWSVEERYDFDWQILKDEEDPFQNFPYQYSTSS